jgi:hypothetical protein
VGGRGTCGGESSGTRLRRRPGTTAGPASSPGDPAGIHHQRRRPARRPPSDGALPAIHPAATNRRVAARGTEPAVPAGRRYPPAGESTSSRQPRSGAPTARVDRASKRPPAGGTHRPVSRPRPVHGEPAANAPARVAIHRLRHAPRDAAATAPSVETVPAAGSADRRRADGPPTGRRAGAS